MVVKPTFGSGNSLSVLSSCNKYILITMEEPWALLEPNLNNKPILLVFNKNMDLSHLEKFYNKNKSSINSHTAIVGVGGGTSCDSAKFLAWRYKEEHKSEVDLILIPSIISVDAFLCSSIAVRTNNRVKYIGETHPREIIIDYELIKKAPKYLNRAGVSDTISIVSALGDWKLERDEVNGKFDKEVFKRAKKIASDLMSHCRDIKKISERGIKALVEGFYQEVKLCEEWGNARPEEGSEHFFAYCLEAITGKHYIHGNLIGLGILISLYLQGEYAEFALDEILQFFRDIKVQITPENQNIAYFEIRKTLKLIKSYVFKENLQYSIYNSSNLHLDEVKVEEVISFLNTLTEIDKG